MKIYKITEASDYLGVSINTLKTLANNGTNLMEFKKDHKEIIRRTWDHKNVEAAKAAIGQPYPGKFESTIPTGVEAMLTPTVKQHVFSTYAVDIGCGIGRLMSGMMDHFDYITGVDISPTMINHAEEYLAIYDSERYSLHATNGESIPVRDNTVDFVYSMITFQHMPSLHIVQRNLQEAYRILNPSGVVRIQTHIGEPSAPEQFNGIHGYYFRSLEEFRKEFETAGFYILEAHHPYHIGNENWLWVTGQKL